MLGKNSNFVPNLKLGYLEYGNKTGNTKGDARLFTY